MDTLSPPITNDPAKRPIRTKRPENKPLHPTARSRPVGGVLRSFTAPPPFRRSPPLPAVDELGRSLGLYNSPYEEAV